MSNLYPPVPPRDDDAVTGLPSEEVLPPVAGEESVIVATPSAGDRSSLVKDEAAHLGEQAAESGQRVAGVAKDEAAKVASEVKVQVSDLFSEAKEELYEQASTQQERVAAGLVSISDELQRMADNSEKDGMATDLVRQAAAKTGSVALWLGDRDPGSLLEEVRRFAREKPGTFIAIAAAAGVLAGRLTRSVASGSAESQASAAGQTLSTDAVAPAGVTPGSTTAGSVGTRGPRYSSVNIDPDIQAGSATPIYDGASLAHGQHAGVQSTEGGERR
ncbi:hypothetical protein AB4Y63_11935 [Leifsonia sp. YAF41]|uniref:hypothetical protein n=1 Tax=Leifsonia sp. YAF41 TaxID=3233086 RepID=UPI003F9E717A